MYWLDNYTDIPGGCPYTINTSGQYRLNQSVSCSGTAFIINATSVELDLAGYTLTGDGTGDGVNVTNKTGAIIKNGVITGFANGVMLSNASSTTITNMTIETGTVGVNISSSSNNVIQTSILNDLTTAILADSGSTGNTLSSDFIYDSTNYFNVVNNTGFTNVELGHTATEGLVTFGSFNLTNKVVTEGTNIYVQTDFISVDSLALPTLNTSASLTLTTDVGCGLTTVYQAPGFPTSAGEVISLGSATGILSSCAGGQANFSVPGFTGYSLGIAPTFTLAPVYPPAGGYDPGSGGSSGYTTFQYSVNLTEPMITCTLYQDGLAVNTRNITTNGTQHVTVYVGSGVHTWNVICNGTGYNATSPVWVFSTGAPVNNSIILNPTTQQVFSSPQSFFYDQNGDLDVVYFVNTTPTNTLTYKIISGGAISKDYNASLNATKPFLVGFREGTDLWFFSYGNDNATRYTYNLTTSSLSVSSDATTYNVTSNSYYDPLTYANTKNIATIVPTADSYYLYLLPTTIDTTLIRKNLSTTTTTAINSTNATANSRKVAWQTIAKDSSLTEWYYAFPYNTSCGAGLNKIGIFSYNGTDQVLNATPNTNCFNQTNIEQSYVFFEQSDGNTYALEANLNGNTTVFWIEGNKSYTFNYTVTNPSRMIFIDNSTLVFYSTEGGIVYAYSCYFGGTSADCSRINSNTYGTITQYQSGPMTTSKRASGMDLTASGIIYNSNTSLMLSWAEIDYDIKYKCVDEQAYFRKQFVSQIFTSNSSTVLSSPLWGYVTQSSLFGNQTKKDYITCTNGTQRLYVLGVSNLSFQAYSLNWTQGVYCQFVAKDIYGNPLQDVLFTAYRFDNSIQQFATVEQGISDVTGSTILYLQPASIYSMTMNLNGYLINAFQFTPICTSAVQVQLNSNSTTIYPMPGFNTVLSDVSWAILPNNVTYAEPDINISYQVSSANSTLNYFGWQVVKTYNFSTTTIASSNVSGQPAGGLLNVTTNGPGVYTVMTWWKSSLSNSTYYPNPVTYYLGNVTGLAQVGQELSVGGIISPWSYYLILVILTMLVAGFVARYSVDGAGVIGLIILWGGSILWPASLGLPGALSVVTTITATLLTTVAVVAGLIVKNYL
jgi:hypothetical protein